MQRYDCHKSIFLHTMYFGEYYSIVRKYPVVVYTICGVGERSVHPKLCLSICHCTEIIFWWEGIFDGKKPVVLERDTALRNLTGDVTCKGIWKGSTRFKCGIFKYTLKMNVRTHAFQGNWLRWWFCIWQIVRISELEFFFFFVVMMNFLKAENKLALLLLPTSFSDQGRRQGKGWGRLETCTMCATFQ